METDDDSLDFTAWHGPITHGCDDDCIRFAAGVTFADLSVAPSDDGHHLMIYCRNRLISVLGSMGGDIECFRFADGGYFTAEELLARL